MHLIQNVLVFRLRMPQNIRIVEQRFAAAYTCFQNSYLKQKESKRYEFFPLFFIFLLDSSIHLIFDLINQLL